MSCRVILRVQSISKFYQVFDKPIDRLKQYFISYLNNFFPFRFGDRYTTFSALENIRFDLREGETLGIVGRNGSGKSTLLQIICGIIKPTIGNVQTKARISALLELGSGFNPEFTGRENIYMSSAILGFSRRQISTQIDQIIEFANIGEFIDQPVKTYSTGMAMRLAFAVATNVQPDILVIDEALSVGDELFQRKCFAKIEDIKNKGAAIILVSHSNNQITELCDRAILLDSGKQLLIGDPNTVIKYYQTLMHADCINIERIKTEIESQQNVNLEINDSSRDAQSEDFLETYDPNIVSKSEVTHQTNGAIIQSPIIETLQGTKVNNLLSARRYKYKFRVAFTTDCFDVRFGMSLKTKQGTMISGTFSSAHDDLLPRIKSGSVIEVSFEFSCSLNPGIYFMNAGAYSLSDKNDWVVLHRRIEACVFVVQPIRNNLETEVVSLGFVPNVMQYD